MIWPTLKPFNQLFVPQISTKFSFGQKPNLCKFVLHKFLQILAKLTFSCPCPSPFSLSKKLTEKEKNIFLNLKNPTELKLKNAHADQIDDM